MRLGRASGIALVSISVVTCVAAAASAQERADPDSVPIRPLPGEFAWGPHLVSESLELSYDLGVWHQHSEDVVLGVAVRVWPDAPAGRAEARWLPRSFRRWVPAVGGALTAFGGDGGGRLDTFVGAGVERFVEGGRHRGSISLLMGLRYRLRCGGASPCDRWARQSVLSYRVYGL